MYQGRGGRGGKIWPAATRTEHQLDSHWSVGKLSRDVIAGVLFVDVVEPHRFMIIV